MNDAKDDHDLSQERASRLFREMVERPRRYPRDAIIMPLDPTVIRGVLSTERIRLVNEVRFRGPYESMSALAKALNRPVSRVSRDVTDLVVHGLIEVERVGKAKRIVAADRPIWIA